MRLSRCEVRDHINYRKSDRWPSDQFYRPCSGEIANALHLRDFRSPAISSFSTQSARCGHFLRTPRFPLLRDEYAGWQGQLVTHSGLTQRCNLLVEPGDLSFRYRFPSTIGAVELREITGNALVNLRQTALHLGLGEVPIPRVDGLELAAIDRNARFAEQLEHTLREMAMEYRYNRPRRYYCSRAVFIAAELSRRRKCPPGSWPTVLERSLSNLINSALS